MYELINGSPSSNFMVRRGLRQGDPISPFPFALVSEGLVGLVRKAKENGFFRGFRVNNQFPHSLLQFAGDAILVGNVTSCFYNYLFN